MENTVVRSRGRCRRHGLRHGNYRALDDKRSAAACFCLADESGGICARRIGRELYGVKAGEVCKADLGGFGGGIFQSRAACAASDSGRGEQTLLLCFPSDRCGSSADRRAAWIEKETKQLRIITFVLIANIKKQRKNSAQSTCGGLTEADTTIACVG